MTCLALEDERNEAKATIHWRFTTVDARQKLARLYLKLDTADQKTLQNQSDLTTKYNHKDYAGSAPIIDNTRLGHSR